MKTRGKRRHAQCATDTPARAAGARANARAILAGALLCAAGFFAIATASAADPAPAPAAPAPAHESWLDKLLSKLGASKEVDLSRGMDWGVLPGPFYNPDMGLGIGVAAIGLYKPPGTLADTQISTLTLRGLASTTAAFGINGDNTTFFGNDDWRFVASAGVMNVPTYYWGIGTDMAEDDDNKEKYTKQELTLAPVLMRRVLKNIYVGAGINIQNTHATKLERGDDSKILDTPEGASVFSAGVTLHFSYDTRDFLPNPSRGQDFQADLSFFDKAFGSDTSFQLLDWQYNIYIKVSKDDIMAFDIHGRFTWGDVTWNMLSQMGGQKRMRGYLQGQYRDKNLFEGQVEYRHHIAGRHGMVAWAGTGVLADTVGGLPGSKWLPNCGIGYRLEFKPRVNIRFDLGFGRDTTGFYFQINEAF